MVLFWTPLVAWLYPFVFRHMQSSFRQWLISVTVSTVAFSLCYGGAALFGRNSRAGGYVAGALILPFSTYAGLFIASSLFDFPMPQLGQLGGSLAIGVVFMTGFTVMHAIADLRQRAAEAENAQLKAQLSALTAQMNPHLLFNTLNTIASLTQTDPGAAEAVTVQLADLYRGVLDASRVEKHALSEELRLCRAYLEIEHARFGERLSFAIDEDGTDGISCPPLLIQPLVENAVKHGIGPLPDGGRVSIRATRHTASVEVVVEDTGAGMSTEVKPSSTALANLRARLRLAYGERGELALEARSGGGTRARVRFPL